jgi:predicted PurR-regulated permease PerM
MAISGKKSSSTDSLATISSVLLTSFILLALYFGRELLVPLALSALLTFMLAPLATRLQRWFGRIGAVLFIATMLVAATGAVGWILAQQTLDLARQFPSYKQNIQAKLRSIQISGQSPVTKIFETFEDLKDDLPGNPGNDANPGEDASQVITQVRIVEQNDKRLEILQVVLGPVLGPLGTSGLVLLLLIFMLLQREDLRNRIVRLIGQGRISTTSRAMDDAGKRVSKYLLMQLIVNVTYGIPVAIGLFFIGVPNAILWGALATVLRFIPYVGPWIAASFPILISLASSPDWMGPLMTIGLFVVLELISNNVMEPWLYGSSTGVTPIALIVAALAWTWLWGPVGLVLATPLTVCLVVMGRHIPKLEFLSIAMSDEEALTPAEDCYHRLLRAGEHDEMELVDHYLKTNSLAALFDNVLIPVISAAGMDNRHGHLESGQLDAIIDGVNDILEAVAAESLPAIESAPKICCLPAKAIRDQLPCGMLEQLLGQMGVPVERVQGRKTIAELVDCVRNAHPRVVCISAVMPTTIIHARYLVSKLRANFPDLRIIVGLWARPSLTTETITTLKNSGADEIVTTLAEAINPLMMIEDAVPLNKTNDVTTR